MYQPQIAPQSQSQSSAKNELTVPLCIELFTRFFTRILEKDPKMPSYLNQWTEFKNLMTQTPLDLDNLFIHLATIQINLEKTSSNPTPVKPAENFLQVPGQSGGALSHRANLEDYKVTVSKTGVTTSSNSNYSPSPRSRVRSMTDHRHASFSLSTQDLNELDRSRRTSIQVAADELSRAIEQHHSISTSISGFNPILTPSQIFEASELNLVKTRSNDITEYNKSPDFANFMDSFKKADLTFLASKSRALRENIHIHNDKAIDAFQNKKQKMGGFQLEERTPLRKFVVHAAGQKEENKNKTQQAAIHQAAEQFSMQYQSNPSGLTYGTKAIIHY